MSDEERPRRGRWSGLLSGKRHVAAALVFVPLLLAAAGFGMLQLQEELGEAGGGPCVDLTPEPGRPETGGIFCLGDVPTPACPTGYLQAGPVGADGWIPCEPLPPCDGCTIAPTPGPSADPGPLKPNPAAELSSPPVHRAGDSKALGRADCPDDWQAALSETTGMSVCFPKGNGELTGGAVEFRSTAPGQSAVWEDRLGLTLTGKGWPVAVTVEVVRSAGLSGPYDLECGRSVESEVDGLLAFGCLWGNGKNAIPPGVDAVVPASITAYVAEKGGFQWVVHAVIWTGRDQPDVTAADLSEPERIIREVLATLRLP